VFMRHNLVVTGRPGAVRFGHIASDNREWAFGPVLIELILSCRNPSLDQPDVCLKISSLIATTAIRRLDMNGKSTMLGISDYEPYNTMPSIRVIN